MPQRISLLLSLLPLFLAAYGGDRGFQQHVDRYLAEYGQTYLKLTYAAQLTDWQSQTHLLEGETITPARTRAAKGVAVGRVRRR